MKLDLRLGNFIFRGRAPLFGRQGAYIRESEGWGDSVDIRRSSRERQQADGEFPERGFASARVVSWSGPWYANSHGELAQIRDQFTSLLADGGYERLYADEENGTMWGEAGLISSTFRPLPISVPMAEYSISVKLPDPRKYGETHRFPEAGPAPAGTPVAAFHRGQTTAWPQFEISGQSPGYRINGPLGRAYIVTRPLLSGQVHLIDMKSGRLYIDGVQVLGGVQRADRWGIGRSQEVASTLIVSSGYAAMRQIVKDTTL
jgi:hypothetical protein